MGQPVRPSARLPQHVRSSVLGALERTLANTAQRLDAVDPPPEPFDDDALRPVLRSVPRRPDGPPSRP